MFVFIWSKELFLFNDTWHILFTVIWQTYGKQPLSKRRNLLPPLYFWLAAGLFLYPTERIAHTMSFDTLVMEHWLEREKAQLVHYEGLIWWQIIPWAATFTTTTVFI